MRAVIAIAVREWRTLLGSPLAWGAAAGFLLLGGMAFFRAVVRFQDLLARHAVLAEITGDAALGARVDLNEVVVRGTARALLLLLVFLVPLIAMRAFAEDRAHGVEEWILTAPVGPGRVVLGKGIAIGAVVLAIVAATAVFPGILFRYGDPEPGPVWTAWLGLALAALALTGIGLACSAWARSQGLAATVALVVGLGLFLVESPARAAGERLRPWLEAVALPARFDPMTRGLVTVPDVTWFLVCATAGLFVARIALALRRWP